MASGGYQGVKRQLGGYDYEFVSEVPEMWKCLICKLPLKDPMQIEGCGHRLCQICIDQVMRRPRATCPKDRTPITSDKVFRDAGCKRDIEDLHVKCPIKDCSWTGQLRAVEAHGTNCLHALVSCNNAGCQKKLKRTDLPAHMNNTCDWRIVECEHCHDNLPRLHLSIHWKQCKLYPLPCENGCGVNRIAREKMENHLTECPLTVITCEYKYLGCEVKSPRGQMNGHMAAAIQHHLDLACRKLKQQDVRFGEEEMKCKLQESKLVEQQERLQRQERKIDEVRSEFTKKMDKAEKKIDEQRQQILIIHSEFSEKMEKAEKKTAKAVDKLDAKTETVFTWKYRELRAHQVIRDGYLALSDSFYLRGYRMNCFIAIKKHTGLPGDNLSIYVGLYINAGDFDSDMEWPFSKEVQIKLSSCTEIHMVQDKHIVKPKKPIPRPKPGLQIEIGSACFGTIRKSTFFPRVTLTVTFVEETD